MKQLLEQLQNLIPLAEAATAGPWCASSKYAGLQMVCDETLQGEIAEYVQPKNAALIVAARNVLTPENLTLITTQQEQTAKLQAFKDFVHTTLDAADVDKHEEQNATTGCRIGARLRDLIGNASQAKHSYHCAQQAYAREMDAIIARDNAQASQQALCAALAPQWVAFVQAQPFHKSDVLLCRKQDKAVVLGHYLAFDQWNRPNMCVVGGGFNTMDKFTHWMPLPTPPATTEGAQPRA